MPFARIPAPRDLDPGWRGVLARATRTPISCTRTSCTRTSTARSAHCAERARLDEAQRRSVPRGRVPLRRACARAPRRDGDRDHRGACAVSPSSRSACRRRRSRSIHYGLDELPAAWGANPPDPPCRRRARAARVCRLEPQKGVDVAVRALPRVRPATRTPCSSCSARARSGGSSSAGAELERAGAILLGRVPRRRRLAPPRGRARASRALGGLRSRAARGDARLDARRRDAVSSIPEIVADGETGLLVPPDDARSPGGCAHRVLDEPGELRRARPSPRRVGVQRRTYDRPDARALRAR